MSMEFWGVEVKAGKPLKVQPGVGKLIHISQAALGEGKRDKGSELVPLRVNINDKKFVVGSLSEDKFPQINFDLVFEKEFELSHDWKNGSVYFCGYMADHSYDEQDDDEFDSDDDDEDLPLPVTGNGKVEPKTEVKPAVSKGKEAKPESSAKPKVTVVEPKKEESDSDDDSDDSLEDDEDMVDADSDDVSESGDDDDDSEDDDDDDSENDDEETPKKPVDKKRPNESASKTPVPAKKSKADSAQKTDGKKGGHVATPYPSKKAEKAPASNKQTPKSGAQISCSSCPKKFNSDSALQSHTKAKHAAK